MSRVPKEFGALRITDLLAKMAQVHRKDVIRILLASRFVGSQFDMTLNEMVPDNLDFDLSVANPQHVAACEQAMAELQKRQGFERTAHALKKHK